ncbi:redoxin domain-containing protein [Mariniflexile aquimaris]|uniref:Redoxin domain-containing protein n=1 Tax=Mariniflexile aquimaris TaxID=881009 RepID=A0ABW3BVK2_9FLAO
MKNLLTILTLFLFSHQLVAQELNSNTFTITKVDSEFKIDKLYNKQTGKKISKKEFDILIENNPNLSLESVYDKYGKIIKYYYDSNSTNNNIKRSGNAQPENGKMFPDFVLKTIDNKKISLNDLKGKLIVLRFELFADNFRFKKNEIVELDTKINETNRKSEIESIIIFTTPKEEILKGFDIKNSNFKLVPNGSGFHNSCHITRYPTTMIIDKNGNLIDSFKIIDDINLIELLNR